MKVSDTLITRIVRTMLIVFFILIMMQVPSHYTYASDTSSAASSFASRMPVVTVSTYKDVNRIKWKKINSAVRYSVYRSTSENGRYKLLGKTKGTKFDDAKSNSGKVYYYKVRAFNSSKKASKYSVPVRFQTIYRVFIACGHGINYKGIWDSGCTYKGMQEAKLMLPITKSFVRYMRRSGVYVYTDADKDNNLNLIKCVRKANKKRISAYISIHCDWSNAPSGTLPLYGSSDDKKLAKALNKGVHKTVKIKHRRLQRNPNLRELYKTKAVSCIFETGSISQDYKIFRKHYKAYGKGLAIGLCKYLKVDFKG